MSRNSPTGAAYTPGVGARGRWSGRARTAEAMALLTVGGAVQRWVPMTRWAGWLGTPAGVPDAWRGSAVQRLIRMTPTPLETQVRAAVNAGSEHLPWEPTCLAQALAAQVMLRRRGSAGVVVIGLRRSSAAAAEGAEDPGADGWEAHAWLMAPSGVLTGGPAARGFTATSVFEVPGRCSAEVVAASGLVG